MSFFITGTDTDVGKTLVSAWLCAHAPSYSYFKPVQSGSDVGTDTDTVKTLSPDTKTFPSTYTLKAFLSPHHAAEDESVSIDLEAISMPPTAASSPPWIVEGAGGVFVPLNHTHTMMDLIKRLSIPVLIVTRGTLGTLNHTLLTLYALKHHGISVSGIIMSGAINPRNKDSIEKYGGVPVLAHLPFIKDISYENIKKIPLPLSLRKCLEKNI
jgi:dethiobiotin synthase